jgi:hypothetical protein
MEILFVLFLFWFGYMSFFNREFMWKWTKWSNDANGVESKRTEAWEEQTTFLGCLAISAGILFFLLFVVIR